MDLHDIKLNDVEHLLRKNPSVADCEIVLHNFYTYLEYYNDTARALDYCRALCMNLFIVADIRDLVNAFKDDNPFKNCWETLLDYSSFPNKDNVRVLYLILSTLVSNYLK